MNDAASAYTENLPATTKDSSDSPLIAQSSYCNSGVVISTGMNSGFDGRDYFISYDFTRGVEKINPTACGREYQTQPASNQPHYSTKFVYLVDGYKNRVSPILYVEQPGGKLQVFNQNSSSSTSADSDKQSVTSLDDGNTIGSSSSSISQNASNVDNSSSSVAVAPLAIAPQSTNIEANAVGVNAKINFQPSSAFVPSGYIKDTGLAYSSTRGFGWVRQDSLSSSNHIPLDISPNTRNRDRSSTVDQRLDTIIHMQYPSGGSSTTAIKIPAAWEYNVPNGKYNVTASVGDQPPYDATHRIRVEGKGVIRPFTANSGIFPQEYELNTIQVDVTDGKLTIDAIEGSNTKLNYIEISSVSTSVNHPSITGSSPVSREPDVSRSSAVILDVKLPNGKGVDPATLTTNNVKLYRTFDNTLVPGSINTSGGGDSIVYQPTSLLAASTNYTFRLTNGVKDESGADFLPYSRTFTTGTRSIKPTPGVSWNKSVVYSGSAISTLLISPNQRKLYGAGLDGSIRRWNLDSQGNLSNEQVFNDTNNKLTGRAIIGMAFNPNLTSDSTLWISHNDPLSFDGTKSNDFTGKVSRLSLQASNFDATVADFVVGLPRSVRDHLTNSLTYGPDNKLYLSQGSNNGMGAPDPAWGQRPERLLSAAVLRIDQGKPLPLGGFNVQTEDYIVESGPNQGNLTLGNYNPSASGAPVTIFAGGVRNAYDLVWHSNGNLYLPTNGSAAGSNTPDDPNTTASEALIGVGTQNDFLFKVSSTGGGYYGHPNPKRNNYILNGGNPTSGVDPAEVIAQGSRPGYPVGTKPDPNYKSFAYDFGRNRSPDGVLEYKSNTFNGALKNKILVVEYSAGDDILALPLDANGNVPSSGVTQVASGFTDPVDIVEDTKNAGNIGTLYIAELINGGVSGRITRLRPSA